jgi:DNA polymerase-3 subunit epsilon/exodeoxyribonuclease X
MLIFLDLETTGLEYEDKICSIASIVQEEDTLHSYYELINEGKKIPAKASSIHHITNEMIQNKTAFCESEIYALLQKHNNNATTLVAHNIPFDLEKLSNAGLDWMGEVIDTMRVTKHLMPECEFFSLQYLRYELKLYRDEQKAKQKCGIKDALFAHHALGDALVAMQLYEVLLELASQEKMISLSQEKVLQTKFSFGKYEGKYIEEIAMNDRGYLEWMLHTLSDLDEDMKYTLAYYLEG